jgi:hypothetical protein
LGASREVVGSRGEMAVGDAGEKHIIRIIIDIFSTIL